MKLEMRALKNIAAAAMTLAVVFGAASLKPVTANAAEASVSASIEEENSYISFQDEAYQNEFLRRVNNERAKAGLKPVQLGDSSHNSAAQERAKELASLIPTFVPMASAISPSSPRMASKMCRLARTTWRAFPPPMQRWISG